MALDTPLSRTNKEPKSMPFLFPKVGNKLNIK